MKCTECYWSSLNTACCGDRVCCNTSSKNYNKVFSAEEIKEAGCDQGELQEEVEFGNLTAWEYLFNYYG